MLTKESIQNKLKLTTIALIVILSVTYPEVASAGTPDIIFPIVKDRIDDVRWSDTWGAPRSSNRTHQGVDILGERMIPLVAVESGTIGWSQLDNSDGNYLFLEGNSGWRYAYVHLNNDTPGTDDGNARCDQAFSAKLCKTVNDGQIERGTTVAAGEVIGYMGDSGNAEATTPHLHFEIQIPNGNGGHTPINPTALVNAAFDNDKPIYIDPKISSVTIPEAQILRLYKAYFNRVPNQEGFEYWLDIYQEGDSLEEIAEYFTGSSEFFTRFSKLSESEYIDQLYLRVLGRLPDEEGKIYWLDEFEEENITRSSIVVYFSEGPEMKQRYKSQSEVIIGSLIHFDRTPSQSEINKWIKARKTGSLADALEQFLNSIETSNKVSE